MLTFPQLCEVATIKNKRLTKNKITMKENISKEEQNQQSCKTGVMQSVLKCTDLRIGNLVYSKETNQHQKITGLTDENPFIDAITFDYTNYDEIEAIPISEEILFNFGYRKEHDIYFKNNSLLRFIGKEIFYSRGEIDDAEFQEYITSIKYVHELQNLYFVLTQRELTVA